MIKRFNQIKIVILNLIQDLKGRDSDFRQNDNTESPGFSTVEMLIAFLVVILSITAVVGVVFGSQSIGLDTETNQEAQLLAQDDLEDARALSRQDFNSVNTVLPYLTTTPGGLTVTTTREVLDISPCAKQVSSVVTWLNEIRDQLIKVSTVVSSPPEAIRLGNNCSPFQPGSWDTPRAFDGLNPSDFHGQGTSIAVASIGGRRYVFLTTDNSSQENFWVIDTTDFDASDPNSITASDIAGVRAGTEGLNGIAVVGNYAYVIHNDISDHLMVVDISDPLDPQPVLGASETLPDLTNGIPRSIFYYDKRLYIGTQYVPCPVCPPEQNNELHIFDVSVDPADPSWEASIDVNRNVNDIAVRDGLAYLATGPGSSSPYTPMKIFDVDPSSPTYLQQTGSFAILINREGTSLYLLGNRLYLGLERTSSSGNDFYVVDVNDPGETKELGSTWLGGNNTEVGDIVIQGRYGYLGIEGTGSQNTFQVWDIIDPDALRRINTCTSGNPFPQNLSGLIYMDDLIFASFRSNEAFKILYDDPSICLP